MDPLLRKIPALRFAETVEILAFMHVTMGIMKMVMVVMLIVQLKQDFYVQMVILIRKVYVFSFVMERELLMKCVMMEML